MLRMFLHNIVIIPGARMLVHNIPIIIPRVQPVMLCRYV
jgi:hypothetical protein